jgi:hypothetical protein
MRLEANHRGWREMSEQVVNVWCKRCKKFQPETNVKCVQCGAYMHGRALPDSAMKFISMAMFGLVGLFIVSGIWTIIFGKNDAVAGPKPTAPAHVYVGEQGHATQQMFCTATPEGWNETMEWYARNDREEAVRVMLRVGGGFLERGQGVKVLDSTGFLPVIYKVRVTEKPSGALAAAAPYGHECYVGGEFIAR